MKHTETSRPSANNLLVLSGCDRIRFPTMVNHKAYADRHGYRYRFDISPRRDRENVYFHKLSAIQDALVDCEWLFWIDDDAAFTRLDSSFESIVPELADPSTVAVFCASPVNPMGGWTTVSSGNFFIRGSALGHKLIAQALATDLQVVEKWWDEQALGMFTNGDQDALVYLIKTDPEFEAATRILDYERFNTRPYHFGSDLSHFLVHFTHLPGTTKEVQMREFAEKHGLDDFFLPPEASAQYASYEAPQRAMLAAL